MPYAPTKMEATGIKYNTNWKTEQSSIEQGYLPMAYEAPYRLAT
jgi:hypothetical protein